MQTRQEAIQYCHSFKDVYKKYPSIIDNGVVIHDTVNDVISRIQRTEYKRKRLPIVPDIKFE